MAGAGRLLVGMALVFGALLLATAWREPYGLFHDEFYYWACSKRLGLGYVDHPPLAPWLLAASQPLLGDGILGFRLVPALCGAGTLLLTGLMARSFGAGRYGQLVAGLGMAVAPFPLAFFGFYSVNALEILLWTATCFVVAELLRTRNERLWLALGVLAGLALLNKHTFALLGFGLALGVLATPLRAQLRSRWLWLGAGVALLLASPNLYWNAVNEWPSLAFYQSREHLNLPTTVGEALFLQLAGMNPANALLWAPGAAFLLFSRRARPYRPLGIAFLVLWVVILVSGQRRGDRIAGVYPLALAAGAAFWDGWRGRGHGALRWALPALMLAFGALLLPASLPVLPPERMAPYFQMLGEDPEIEAVDVGQKIPVHLMGRLGWERFVDEVLAALALLSADERERAVILVPHWVYGSALEYLARDRDLPPVVSPHNAYFFWRGEAAGREVVVTVASEVAELEEYFAAIRSLGLYRCEYCPDWRPNLPILASYRPVRPLQELLVEWRTFSIRAAPDLVGWYLDD